MFLSSIYTTTTAAAAAADDDDADDDVYCVGGVWSFRCD